MKAVSGSELFQNQIPGPSLIITYILNLLDAQIKIIFNFLSGRIQSFETWLRLTNPHSTFHVVAVVYHVIILAMVWVVEEILAFW